MTFESPVFRITEDRQESPSSPEYFSQFNSARSKGGRSSSLPTGNNNLDIGSRLMHVRRNTLYANSNELGKLEVVSSNFNINRGPG